MTTNKKSSFLRIGLIIGLWLCLWYLTPNLHSYGIGSQITNNGELSIFIETIIALILAIILMYFHQRYNQQLFKWSKIVYFYTVPLVLAVLLPLYYNLSLPVYLYVFWMSISVFWQDYLTYGLLQNYLNEQLPKWIVVLLVSVTFYIGHAVFLPHKFAPVHILPSLGILCFGAFLAFLRMKLKTLHLILILHISFYFIFVF